MTDGTQVSVKNYTEGPPWFWKIFGGAIISSVSVLLFSYMATINNNFDRNFQELRGDIKELKQIIDVQKERISRLEQDPIREQKMTALETSNIAIKEELKALREWCKEISKSVSELREKVAAAKAAEQIKK
jgi:septal ring factor EnvC (AmiA/AmiB activator)